MTSSEITHIADREVLRVKKLARLTCECGYTEDVPLLDKLDRGGEVRQAYRSHQKICSIQGPIIEEARALVLRLKNELFPRLGMGDGDAAYRWIWDLEKILGIKDEKVRRV